MADEKFKAMADEWLASGHSDMGASLAALLSRVDAEATERAAKVCDDRVEWSHGSPYEPACPRNSESQEAYDCASAIRSTLPTPAARAGEENQ